MSTFKITGVERFLNRELSWLDFNERVLAEAEDEATPPLERAKFLSIVSTNLDEFFMVRVAALFQSVSKKKNLDSPDNMDPKKVLNLVGERSRELIQKQYAVYHNMMTLLEPHGIKRVFPKDLTETERQKLFSRFHKSLFGKLRVLSFEEGASFRYIRNRAMTLVVELTDHLDQHSLALVVVPAGSPRVWMVDEGGADHRFLLLEDLVAAHLVKLLAGLKILGVTVLKITRDGEIPLADLIRSGLEQLERGVKSRERAPLVRIEYETGSERVVKALTGIAKKAGCFLFEVPGPVDLKFLTSLVPGNSKPELRDPPVTPIVRTGIKLDGNIFDAIAERDLLLHHPYDAFDPVVSLVVQAAEDPQVVSIRQTIYRTTEKSPMMAALMKAAENGKHVTVFIEVTARFDESNNIKWLRELSRAGVHAYYARDGFKTHSKITVVSREENGNLKHYVHLGTGNYNPVTAKLYTDLSLLTCHKGIGEDSVVFFHCLTGLDHLESLRFLVPAPISLKETLLGLIKYEISAAKKDKPARIMAKLNSLVDQEIIELLYKASRAGVKVDLVVRGICCLVPGVPGLSENITVRSIVDRFLEHSRIYYFYHGGAEKVYLASADWMPRNFERRIELMFPLLDPRLKNVISHFLFGITLADNTKSRTLNANGKWKLVKGRPKIRSQEIFLNSWNDPAMWENPQEYSQKLLGKLAVKIN